MVEKTIKFIKDRDIQIPSILFYNYKKLNITEEELIVIIYLMNNTNEFDLKTISTKLNIEPKNLLELINNLNIKGLLSIDIVSKNNIKQEFLSIESIYKKIILLEQNEKENKQEFSNIFNKFEQEFARTLSPIEYEIINTWLDNDFSEEVILLALKEAVYNGVNNLRYIDKILFEWRKKGIKNKKDMDLRNKKKQEQPVKKEIFSYDWLNDTDE